MSFQAMTWAADQIAGGPSGKATLWAIANIANEHDVAWPSQELLAEQSEQSVDSVGRRLKELGELRLLRRIPLKFAGRKTVDFLILARSKFFGATLEDIELLLPRGCEVDPRYHAPADCGSAEGGIPGSDAPADCGSALPQTLPQSAENVTATVREQEPVTEPIEPRIERDARAGEPEPDPEADQDFQSLRGKIAKLRGPQAIGRSFPIWLRLDPAARALALNGWEACLAAWSQGGQKHAYGLETYLRDRMWEQVTTPAGDVPKVVLALRSGEWFAFFWAAWVARDLKICASMIRMAKLGSGYGCPAAEIPSSDEIQAMPRVKFEGPEWHAWRKLLERDDLRIGNDMIVPAWVWVPTEWPQEDLKTARVG